MTRQRAQSQRASLLGVMRGLWSYRRLVLSLVRRDLQQRSAGTVWGHAWLVLKPATQIAIYTVIFGSILGARLPGVDDHVSYGLFLCAGIIHWNHFSELVAQTQSMFLEHADIVKSLRVPRSTLPTTVFLSSLVNYGLAAGLFLVALALLGRWPGALLLAAIPLFLLQSLIGVGLGVLTGALNVFFRDIAHATGVVLQIWFWATPIVYPVSILPEAVRALLPWNPLYAITIGYQRIVIDHVAPDWWGLVPVLVGALLLFAVAWGVFRGLSSDLVDEL